MPTPGTSGKWKCGVMVVGASPATSKAWWILRFIPTLCHIREHEKGNLTLIIQICIHVCPKFELHFDFLPYSNGEENFRIQTGSQEFTAENLLTCIFVLSEIPV